MKLNFLLLPAVSLLLLAGCNQNAPRVEDTNNPNVDQTRDLRSDVRDLRSDFERSNYNRNMPNYSNNSNTFFRSDDANLTPFNQSANSHDLTITQRIRQSLVSDNSLSTTAKNIKVITVNGVVTLRGEVRNSAEKSQILNKARGVEGVKTVRDELNVSSSSY